MPMTLAQKLREYIAACFTGLWIRTDEPDDALLEIARLCREQHWRLATWDIDRGLRLPEQPAASPTGEVGDPLAALRALPALATPEGTAVLVLVNFHRFLGSAEVVQALAHQVSVGKHSRTFTLILAPLVQVPRNWTRPSWSSNTTCLTANNWRPLPGASPPSPASCPMATS